MGVEGGTSFIPEAALGFQWMSYFLPKVPAALTSGMRRSSDSLKHPVKQTSWDLNLGTLPAHILCPSQSSALLPGSAASVFAPRSLQAVSAAACPPAVSAQDWNQKRVTGQV